MTYYFRRVGLNKFRTNIDLNRHRYRPIDVYTMFHPVSTVEPSEGEAIFTYKLADKYKPKLRDRLAGRVILPAEIAKLLVDQKVVPKYTSLSGRTLTGKYRYFYFIRSHNPFSLSNWILGTLIYCLKEQGKLHETD